jgi:PKD repeat protein
LVADYGAFQIWRVGPTLAGALADQAGVEDAREQDFIELNTGSLDTTTPEIQALRQAVNVTSGKRLHLVQFAGPIKPEWMDALVGTGVQVVTYIPHNAYLVYGDGASLSALQSWAAREAFVQWEGAFADDYKLHPAARLRDSKGNPQKPPTTVVAIQMVADSSANPATLRLIDELKLEPVRQQYSMLGYLNVVVSVTSEQLPLIAAQPEVISIQLYPEPQKRDERQDQIIAGNLSGTVPSGPGYLAWLASEGFTQGQFDASGFAVNVSDSGIDNGTTSPGHFGMYVSGDITQASRVLYNRLLGTPNPGSTIQGCDGHGNLNSHIIAAFSSQPASFPHGDAAGYLYDLGVCPFVRVGSSVVFDPDTFTSPNYAELESRAYNDNARIDSNSWGANTQGSYTTDCQAYDALVRDAQPAGSAFPADGNQQMVIVFAAGNAGSGAQTVGSPAAAKNVFTIGASDNVRSMSTANGGNNTSGNDGCDIPDSNANSANDIIFFSSRGPCADGRIKPDLVAPGTHVTGGVGQTSPPPSPAGTGSALACFAASGVCGQPGGGTVGSLSNFFPAGQQFYTESSGTSHSTPCVAGCCALLRQYFINQGWTPPSPAMTKAYLMNSARYLDGVGANDSLFSNTQGMGEVNLGAAFDGVGRILHDQISGEKFTATGQTRTYAGTIVDNTKGFRVTLAWSDAPGNTSGNAFNNNLDLTVSIGGNIYKGNVFSGQYSSPGGAADTRNNVESVFLPAGTSGNFLVTITAANINSDGVPNEAPSLDQDYALVVYNAALAAGPAIIGDSATLTAENCSPYNGTPDPGETVTYNFSLRNIGTTDTTNLTVVLLATNGVSNPSAPQTYGRIVAGGAAVTNSFTFVAIGACGDTILPTLQLQDGSADLGTANFALQMGQFAGFASENFDSMVTPALPAGWTTTATGAQSRWVTTTASSDTAPNSVFCPDPTAVGLAELTSPVFSLPQGPAQVSFRHNYYLESGYDGGVLEISINGGGFTDILAAGGSFASGGYSGTLSSGTGDPLGGRAAWTGNSAGYITTLINLPAAAAGQPIQLKWRCGSDSSVGYTGWYVDTLSIAAQSCCNNSPVPIPLFSARPQLGGAPLAVTFSDGSSGNISNRFWTFGDGHTTNTMATNFVYTYLNPGTNTVSLTVSSQYGTNSLTRVAFVTVTNPIAHLVADTVLPVVVSGGNGNGQVDPNECNDLVLRIVNGGTAPATNISAVLSTTTPGVQVVQANSTYPDLAPGATGANVVYFRLSSSSGYTCGTAISLSLALTYGSGSDAAAFSPPVGSTGYTITQSTGAAIIPGTVDTGNHYDDGVTLVNFPFNFVFYGTSYASAQLSSNGNLQFNTALTDYANLCLPYNSFNDAICPFWDDLITTGAGQGIFTSISGSAPNRIFNIEWRAAYYNPQNALNFELRLYENSPRLDMIYGTLNGTGSSATVGVQHGTQFSSFECNNGGLAAGLQLTFQPGGCPDGGGACLPPATTIATPILSGSNLSFSFATVAGFSYTVVYKDSLGDPTWQVLQTVPGDGTLKTINVSATTPGQRFYRISAQ